MPQLELLEKTVRALHKTRIPYMLTGSIVSSFQGTPRSTHDIDVVVSISQKDIPSIIEAFPPDYYYINQITIKQAISNKGQFNIIDISEGDKIDFWLLTNSEFDKARFSRRQKVKLINFQAYISSPEDTILQKLYWSKLSGDSIKQYNDALGIFEIQYSKIDTGYINRWSRKLGIETLLKKIKKEANIDS